MSLRLALVGLGKIARDQHLPAIAATPGLELVAIASRHAAPPPDLPSWPDIDGLLAHGPTIDAVTLCTPPQGRFAQAQAALAAGKHVMLEKPPGATLAEVRILQELAAAKGVSLYATWHSRAAAAVEPARALLAERRLRSVVIRWREDVRRWHPGQGWIWQPGGLGVFDPGINALSIATRILPEPFFLAAAELHFPANRAAPIAAELEFRTTAGVPVRLELDWRRTGEQTWEIAVETESGPVLLTHGGSCLHLDGVAQPAAEDREYRHLYARFAELVRTGTSDVDLTPLIHVADAFMLGHRRTVEPFLDQG